MKQAIEKILGEDSPEIQRITTNIHSEVHNETVVPAGVEVVFKEQEDAANFVKMVVDKMVERGIAEDKVGAEYIISKPYEVVTEAQKSYAVRIGTDDFRALTGYSGVGLEGMLEAGRGREVGC